MKKIGKAILRITLALLAPIAGFAVGRPYSGLWLSHYFLGSGKERKLPRKLERELLKLWNDSDVGIENADFDLYDFRHGCQIKYEELRHVPDDVHNVLIMCTSDENGNSEDLYTTVGGLLMWRVGDGLSYLDVYDWHPGDTWEFDMGWLPFFIRIKGQDQLWADIGGKSFLTRGTIKLED